MSSSLGRVCDNIITVEEKFDWTYTTEYTGAMENKFGNLNKIIYTYIYIYELNWYILFR